MEYESNISGPLFLKMNLNKGFSNPKGSLKIKVSGVKDMTLEQIDYKLGWKNDVLDNSKFLNNIKLSSIERSLLIFINNLRTNPTLFAVQYLQNIKFLTNKINNIYNYILNNTNKLTPLIITEKLIDMTLSYSLDLSTSSNSIKYLKKILVFILKNMKILVQ